jgi:hypothetical protein
MVRNKGQPVNAMRKTQFNTHLYPPIQIIERAFVGVGRRCFRRNAKDNTPLPGVPFLNVSVLSVLPLYRLFVLPLFCGVLNEVIYYFIHCT